MTTKAEGMEKYGVVQTEKEKEAAAKVVNNYKNTRAKNKRQTKGERERKEASDPNPKGKK